MHRLLRKSVLLVGVLVLIISVVAFAEVVWQRGSLNYITNEHPSIFHYEGYGQCNSSVPDAGEFFLRVAIRYRIDGVSDTGYLWTPNSAGNTVSVSKTFYDSLNPFAPVTEFYYDVESTNK